MASGSPDNEGKEEGVPEESWPKKLLLIPSSSDVLGQYASARCVPPEVPSCHLASSLLCLTRSPGHTCVLSNTDLNISDPYICVNDLPHSQSEKCKSELQRKHF